MSSITAEIRVEHPDLALTETIVHDPTATVKPISEAGTDPESGNYLFTVRSSDFDDFDAGLRSDPTIADFDRVIQTQNEAIYRFQYTGQAKLFSPIISTSGGVALKIENDGIAWIITVWMPSRDKLASLWDFASEHGIDIELLRVNEYASPGDTELALTDSQREALLVALNAGYFEEPRKANLGDVAAELGISQPAAGGLLRRGIKRLLLSTLDVGE